MASLTSPVVDRDSAILLNSDFNFPSPGGDFTLGDMLQHSPQLPTHILDKESVSSASSSPAADQVSPSSAGADANNMDIALTGPSSSTSNNDLWNDQYGEQDDLDFTEDWGDQCDTTLPDGNQVSVPKLEPVEDDILMQDIQAAQPTNDQQQSQPTLVKRPRGRPRKHPLPSSTVAAKITKGRSKTGCITCRKRKKKCDEAKPRCRSFFISFLFVL